MTQTQIQERIFSQPNAKFFLKALSTELKTVCSRLCMSQPIYGIDYAFYDQIAIEVLVRLNRRGTVEM